MRPWHVWVARDNISLYRKRKVVFPDDDEAENQHMTVPTVPSLAKSTTVHVIIWRPLSRSKSDRHPEFGLQLDSGDAF